ncbi:MULTISPECIES: YafY family protein [unclassified Saccharibacter]|uniref:helix-turn-helix transcriptional regulator n=1 Tax=unclassified Saccharibacter TaxID=2648722 RepID=UPI00132B30E1|nr:MULTISPECIES: WYL domain-containing protein [unclassified Saccharibacter]MXV36850.1 WYL domain-containing protein [Saccharibacter sp. EH611]MXV58660.1 WYL domain-containing protein [Saccharibacter sp. EH70]MXV66166.1 WYL domain-containing protein [Saccharibacter sp. EH60]
MTDTRNSLDHDNKDGEVRKTKRKEEKGRKEDLEMTMSLLRRMASHREGLTKRDIMVGLNAATPRTAERWLRIMRSVFPQLETVNDEKPYRWRIPNGIDSFINVPTDEELAALKIAERRLKQDGHADAAWLSTLYEKVECLLKKNLYTRLAPDINSIVFNTGYAMQAGARPTADEKILTTLWYALKAVSRVCFMYRGKERCVSPWGLLTGKSYYLVGPVKGEEQPRLWRLDRMAALRGAEGIAQAPPEGWTIQDFAARSFGVWQGKQHRVGLRFSPIAAGDARHFLFHPTQDKEEKEDGSLDVRFQASGLNEMAYHLFTWGTDVTVFAPAELRDCLVDMCKSIVMKYEG